jgi:hypothetical protein
LLEKTVVVEVTDTTIERAPAWHPKDENPPVSARRALKLATELKDTLVKDSEDRRWKFQSASLQKTLRGEHWYWLVTFWGVYHPSGGRPIELQLVVLMDDTAVKPIVKERP